ncbi:hypothetical protein Tco_1213565 [Tanacetum coccineum]
MNEDYYEQNSCYHPNSFDFDQYQPPQFPVNYPPQETSNEILQAHEDLMEAIEAFLKEYDHIPPNEKCMALLLAEERFLKIKQAMEEEQNQPEVMQELLLKLMDDLRSLKRSQQEKKKPTAQSSIPYWNSSMIDNEEARDNFLKDVCTFLRKFSRIPFGVTPKVILIAWESFGEIKDALMDRQYRQEDIQELMSKLLEDVRNISEEFLEYINCPSMNRLLFYFDDNDDEYTVIWEKPKAITPDLPIKEPYNSLNMGDEHLDTILATESDKVIRSSVKNLVPIPSEFEDRPILEEFAGELAHIAPISPKIVEADFDPNDDTSSDDDSFENIEYVEASPSYIEYDSFEEVNDVEQEEKEFNLEDIFQIQDVILREKLLNVHRLISNIESLKVNPTLDHVLKFPSSFPIPVVDSDAESDTSFSHLDNSLPEFETFSDHTEGTRSGNDLLLEIPEFESFHFDQSFLRPPPEPPDVEINLVIETDVPEINDLDKLNGDECFDQGGGEINFEADNSFTFVTWTFLPFLTYPERNPLFPKPSRVRCMDISKITRKPSKTGKHGHEERKSTKEAKDSKPKPRKVNSQSTMVKLQSQPFNDGPMQRKAAGKPGLWVWPLYIKLEITPSSKILVKAEASQKRKASTSGAASSHVAKCTRSALAQSSGSTTRPSLFAGDDDESDDDDDACVKIPLVTPLRSTNVIPPLGNQGRSFVAPTAEGSNSRAGRDRPPDPLGLSLGISGDAIHTNFFPFSAGPYYATYPEDGVAGNCEFTREEWDTPYRPTFEVLTNEVFKDPAICKTIFDQFPTPGEMVRVEGFSDDQLTAKMSVLHCMMISDGGELFALYRGLNQSHHEYVLLANSRLKGYEEKVANMTGKGDPRMNTTPPSFVLPSAIPGLVRKFLASDEFSRVQGELLSSAASAGFERGLSMHQTKDESAAMLKKDG